MGNVMMIKKILTVLGTSVFVHGVAAAQGPTMQFGHADLVTPQEADAIIAPYQRKQR